MFIDFHTHAFPDKIAAGALASIARTGGALTPHTDGTADGLKRLLHAEGGRGVLLPIATKPAQQRHVNDFAAAVGDDCLVCFGSVHPRAADALEELERIKALGLPGVKFHPEFQGFFVDEEALRPIYRKVAQLGLIAVFHAGLDLSYAPPCRCSPERMAKALQWFDGAPVVAAHLGGYGCWEDTLKYLCGLPVYLDTAYSNGHVPLPLARAIVVKHGPERILFGSDTPWSEMAGERDFVRALGLTADEEGRILYGNAAALLGLPPIAKGE